MPQPAFIVNLYDNLINAPDDRTRARVIASAFEDLEERYPALRDLATASGLRETELRLQKEIEQVRAELSIQIAQVRKETEQVRTDLTRFIHETKTELQGTIHKGNLTILRWMVSLMTAQIVAILVAVFSVLWK